METDPLVRRRSSAAPVKVPKCAIRNPRSLSHEIVVVTLMCFLSFGSYFCYDNPAALHGQFLKDLKINESSFMSLYAWYSWPNVVLCFFGGFLVDRVFGVRLGSIIFGTFVVTGQLIFATGAYIHKIWLMDLGRFVFGIGGESLAVVQNTYAVVWFKEKKLTIVFGLQLSMARIGSIINMNFMDHLYDSVDDRTSDKSKTLGISLYIACLTCVFSLLCSFALAYLDRRAERILNRKKAELEEPVRITDVKDFSLPLWLVFLICVFYYVTVFPFIGLGKLFFENKFDFTPASADAVDSVVYLMSGIISPLLGVMMTYSGYYLFWLLFGVFLTLCSHTFLTFTFWNPWIAMSAMGLGYSVIACSLWPLVAYLVPERQLATAYGFMQAIQNLGLALVSLLAGTIIDTKGYFVLEMFFCMCLTIALMCTFLLYFTDFARRTGLNLSAKERDAANDAARLFEDSASTSEYRCFKIKPLTAFNLRNRYYSRIGTAIPHHVITNTAENQSIQSE